MRRPSLPHRECSPSPCIRSAIRSTRSPFGSCATRALAEDALQNALVLAWRRPPKLRDPNRLEAWMHRILVHACYDEFQRARARQGDRPSPSCRVSNRRARPTPRRRSPIATSWSGRSCSLTDRAARGVRVAPLPRAAARGGRRAARHPRGHGPVATPLRNCRAPRVPRGLVGDHRPGRTPRMTDDRSVERAARTWLEERPDQTHRIALSRTPSPALRRYPRYGARWSRGGCQP